MAKYLSPNQRIQKEYQDRKAAEKEKQKAQEKKNAEAKERETNYKEATKTSNFTHPTPPSGSQPPQKATAKSTSNGNNGSSFWVRSSGQPTAAQKREYNEQKNRENGQDSIGRRQYEERKRKEKNKVLAYKKSQRNTSKGYQDMIKRREDAEIKKYEEAFGRKINKGWR